MFDIVEWFHKAFNTESTAAFVLFVAAVFAVLAGGVAFVIDRAYKNSEEREQRKLYSSDFQLDNAALDKMRDALKGTATKPPRGILIMVLGDGEKRKLGQQFQQVFSGAGWSVSGGSGDGEGHGIRVLASDLDPQTVGLVEGALQSAGIRFNVYRLYQDKGNPPVTIQIGELR